MPSESLDEGSRCPVKGRLAGDLGEHGSDLVVHSTSDGHSRAGSDRDEQIHNDETRPEPGRGVERRVGYSAGAGSLVRTSVARPSASGAQ